MKLPEIFLSVDWGTTNFRLRVVETATLGVISECKTDKGIRLLNEQYLTQKECERQHFFADYLAAQVRTLPVEYQSCPIVLSGMASSSIGLQELDYAEFPFDQSGQNLLWKQMTLHNGLAVFLISGVKNSSGMIRGEEIQAIGLSKLLLPYGTGILILPGTHSKHLRYQAGAFTDLTNLMTGELFEVLSKRSILASSVTHGPWTEKTETAFKEGLALGFAGELTAHLLEVRARHVIHHTSSDDSYYFLSGLLVGDELRYLQTETDTIFLAAPDPVFSTYKKGLETLFDPAQLVLFDGQVIERALLEGQKKILMLHERQQGILLAKV